MKTHRFFALVNILLLGLSACTSAPSLWGNDLFVETPASSMATPTPSPVPATATATPVPSVWIHSAVPAVLLETALGWGLRAAPDSQAADVRLELASFSDPKIQWIYALVTPFPTVTDGVSFVDVEAAWDASPSGPFAGLPLWMEPSTLAALTALWGEPATGAVMTAPADQLLDLTWGSMPAWAIIPFEHIEPRWKVLTINGQSPLHKNFDVTSYPLVVGFDISTTDNVSLQAFELPTTNRNPSRLATVILTGVTALTRATAAKMESKGVLYPGEEVRDLLREADVAHINNEVPFYAGCPTPDPNQSTLVFCSAPRYIELLLDIGMDVVELSGDHFADYDAKGMWETLAIYKEHDIPYYGGGENMTDGKKPLLMEVNGNKFMFIACNIKDIYATASDTVPGAVTCDFPYMTEQIRLYREQGYLPIATYQYHEFATPEARPEQQEHFRILADAGAVIVSGSQAHVPQVMEFYNDSFIHYGLGNLFFDQMSRTGGQKTTRREFIDRHVFYNGKYLGVELFTTYLEDFSRPRFMTPEERTTFLNDYFVASGWLK